MKNTTVTHGFNSSTTLLFAGFLCRVLSRPLVALALVFTLFSGGDQTAWAGSEAEDKNAVREYEIKAAFVYNFAKFTEWPEYAFYDADTPLRVCALGHDPIRPGLEALAGKSVQLRQIAISVLGRIEESNSCHLIFVSKSEADELPEIMEYLSHRPILTVSDIDGFADAGGMIALKTVDNKIRFTVNILATRTGGLSLSPQVLRLADIVGHISTADRGAESRKP